MRRKRRSLRDDNKKGRQRQRHRAS